MASDVINEEPPVKACIIIAGNRGCGKSTALNNIFDLNLPSGCSPEPITTNIAKNNYIHEAVEFTVLDTPGGSELREKSAEIKKQIKTVPDYTVLLCLKIDSGNRINDVSNKTTVEALQSILGPEVWKKCVILFTFSDFAREESKDEAAFKRHVSECSKALEDIISSCSPEEGVSKVSSVFELNNADTRDNCSDDIIAIPIGETKECSNNVLPGILENNEDWTDHVLLELMRKTPEAGREAFFIVKYRKELSIFVELSAKIGAGLGAAIGIVGGAIGGPIGVNFGATTGSRLGARTAAGFTGHTIDTIRAVIKSLKAIQEH